MRKSIATPAGAALTEEAAIILPDRDLKITDPDGEPVAITVREYRFKDGLKAQAIGCDLIDALSIMSEDAKAFTAPAIQGVLGGHADAWLELCAIATGKPLEWIERLSDTDGTAISLAVWDVNQTFFLGRLLGATMARQAMSSASPVSSTCSLVPGTDAPSK